MPARQHLCRFCTLLVFLAPVVAQTPKPTSVRRVALVGDGPIQFKIETSEVVVPQVQMVSDPERLVIDIPNSLPGPELHAITMNRGEVKGVRVSLFSTAPPITRIVVDLKEPQWYRALPTASGLVVSLGSDSEYVLDESGNVREGCAFSSRPSSANTYDFNSRCSDR